MKNCVVNHQILYNPIIIGKIGAAYGILGWVKIISFTSVIDNIFNYSPWFIFLENQWKLVYLEKWRLIGKHYIVKLKDFSNRELAISLAQHDIVIDENQFPVLGKEEYYWKDIIGCKIITIHGDFLGYVKRIIETNAHDVLVIKSRDNGNVFNKGKDCLIPFVIKKIIKDVNLIRHTIMVDWNYNF